MAKDTKAVARVRRWRKANPERDRQLNKRSKLQRKFGISLETYEAMLRAQHGCCAICMEPPNGQSLAVDHDHKTGEVRGLLCRACNHGIGNFKDHILLLKSAIAYLSK